MPARTLSPAMAARYGLGRRSPALAVGIGVLVVVFLGILAFVTYHLATNGVQASVVRFVVVDDHRVDVTFDVHRTQGQATTCVLRAQDEHHADVGYATVTITAGAGSVRAVYPLATYARATTAEVLGCAADGPPRVDAPAFLPGTTNPAQQPSIDGS